MGFRIDKIWGQYLQTRQTRQTKTANHKVRGDSEHFEDAESSQNRQQQNSSQEQPHQESLSPATSSPVTLIEVQKAVDEASEGLQLQGVALLALVTPEGIVVRFFATSGQLIRQVSGAEFLQLKVSSHLDKISRGKVLDQKF